MPQEKMLNFEVTVNKQPGARENGEFADNTKTGSFNKSCRGNVSEWGVVLRFGSARVWVQNGGNGDMDQTNVYSSAPVVVTLVLATQR
jgi:hypothetical protein